MLRDLLLHLAAASQSEGHSFILYSKDPHYRLMPTKKGVRRWQLVAEEDLGILTPSGERAPTAFALGRAENARLEDIVDLKPFSSQSSGHNKIFIATAKNGGKFALKWSDSFGLDTEFFASRFPADILGEYMGAFEAVHAPHIPQGVIGTLEELADLHPKFYDAFDRETRTAVKRNPFIGYEIEDGQSVVDFAKENDLYDGIVASPFVPGGDETFVDWRYFGQTPDEAIHNLYFLNQKHLQMERLLGVPDRHPHNYISYAIADPKGFERYKKGLATRVGDKLVDQFVIGFDYDWLPANNETGGIFSGVNYAINYHGGIYDDWAADQLATEVIERLFDWGDLYKKDDKLKALKDLEKHGKTSPNVEATLDILAKFDGVVSSIDSPGPEWVAQVMEEKLENAELVPELVEAWESTVEERTKGGEERSFILFSKDPHYRLKPSKADPRKKRWQLVSEDTGLVAPLPEGPAAPTVMMFGTEGGPRFEDIEEWRPLNTAAKDGAGTGGTKSSHSPVFEVTMRDGSQYALKWSDSRNYRPFLHYHNGIGIKNSADGEYEAIGEYLGVDTPVDLLPEYEKFFREVGAPYIPQGKIGTIEELADTRPDLYDALWNAVKNNKLMWDFHEEAFEQGVDSLMDLAQKAKTSPYLVASTLVKPEETFIDWRYFGEDKHEAAHNLEMLLEKHHAIERFLGLPDRHPGNYLTYVISDEDHFEKGMKGEGRLLPDGWEGPLYFKLGFDYDWNLPSLRGGDEFAGVYNGSAYIADLYGDDVPYDDVSKVGYSSMKALVGADSEGDFSAKIEQLEQAAEDLEKYGVTNPKCEAIADAWGGLRGTRSIPAGEGPTFVIDDIFNNQDTSPLDELSEVWSKVKKERLTGSSG